VSGELLVIGADGGEAGWLYAFERASGELRWKVRPASGTPEGVGFTTDLLQFGDAVLAGAFGDFLASIELANGLPNWEFQGGFDGSQRLLPSSPVLAEGVLYFGGKDGQLYALDAASGRLRWKTDLGSQSTTAIVGDSNGIYAGTEDRRFRKFQPGSGAAVAAITLPAIPGYKPLLWNQTLFVLGVQPTTHLFAIDRDLERILWTRVEPSGWDSPRPRIWKGSLILGTSDGRLLALDPATGVERWSHRLGKSPVRGIGADDQTLYAGTSSGQVFAVRFSVPETVR
jgi:outer membrane protein assembly factor BamB